MRRTRVLVSALALGLLATISSASFVGAQQGPVTVRIGAGREQATATGTVTLTAMGNQTHVEINVAGTNPAMPGHIHADTCPGAGPVVFPFPVTMNGRATVMLDAPLSDVLARGKSINFHKSATEAAIYVGCGNISVAGAQAAPAQAPAALPRTGDVASLAGLFAIAGAGLAGAGYGLRRRFSR